MALCLGVSGFTAASAAEQEDALIVKAKADWILQTPIDSPVCMDARACFPAQVVSLPVMISV